MNPIDLGQFGAPGFNLDTRVDFSGHKKGLIDPHVNVDLVNPQGTALRNTGQADFRDLTQNQMPGFNGMQK